MVLFIIGISFIHSFTSPTYQRFVFWHQEVASDSFCFLINSSWLLVFILYVFSIFFLGFNLYCWKGIHFSQNLDLILLYLFLCLLIIFVFCFCYCFISLFYSLNSLCYYINYFIYYFIFIFILGNLIFILRIIIIIYFPIYLQKLLYLYFSLRRYCQMLFSYF